MHNIARTNARVSIYDRATTKIIQDLEAGTRPWVKPWKDATNASSAIRPRRHDGQPYRGINTLVLWSGAAERGYRSPCWMTYRQAQNLGGQVRKGETATTIVYAGRVGRPNQDVVSSEEIEKTTRFLRSYSVFNAEQVEGLADDAIKPEAVIPKLDIPTRIERAAAFVAATRAAIRTGGSRACYLPSVDRIDMPAYAHFIDMPTSTAAESYYATLFHEIIHWTSPSHRCGRKLGKRFGDHAYAGEELIAEIGAAFLCADHGISLQPRPETAAYIASWLKVLKADNRAVFSAAAFAQKAVDWLAVATMIDSGAA